MTYFNTNQVHPSWQPLLETALHAMDPSYLESLAHDQTWLPGPEHIFNAFSLPLAETRSILFGESPYPRATSANGYAFWDGAVNTLWSPTGLSKAVNRATSLRNFIKMLLVTHQHLQSADTTQPSIAALDKSTFVQSIDALFSRLLQHGVLLLNASLVLSQQAVRHDAKQWQPFMNSLLTQLADQRCDIQLILLGKIAETINRFPSAHAFPQLIAEHPYNLSFIHNAIVQDFFRPMRLLYGNSTHEHTLT